VAVTITSVTFDKPKYAVGETVTMTVNYDTDSVTYDGVDREHTVDLQIDDQTQTVTFLVNDGNAQSAPAKTVKATDRGSTNRGFGFFNNLVSFDTATGIGHWSVNFTLPNITAWPA
jgi:hypothetical protein